MGESRLYTEIPLALSRGQTRLFRFNSGLAWAGEIIQRTPTILTLRNYHPVKLGPAGFSDLAGWDGGRFVAIECKDRGRVTPEQQRFIDLVIAHGGLAGVARSVDDARKIIEGT